MQEFKWRVAGRVSRVGRPGGGIFTVLWLVLWLVNAAAQPTLPVGASERAPDEFSDVLASHWSYPAVDALARLGILTGYPSGTYSGDEAASRYELAVVAARLIDYTDQIVGAVPGARFEERMRRDEVALGRTSLLERVESLESAINTAASLEYVQRIERRLVALEQNLNAASGTDFPARMEDGSQGEQAAQSLTVERSAGTPQAAGTAPGTAQGTVRLSQRPQHPFYIGLAPGAISTTGDVHLSVQAGYDNLIGPVGLASRLTYSSGNDELRLSLDTLVRLNALNDDLDLYGGLGGGYTLRPGGDALLLEAPFGVEYFVTPRVGLFGQLITSYGFAPVNEIDAALTAGVNLRF